MAALSLMDRLNMQYLLRRIGGGYRAVRAFLPPPPQNKCRSKELLKIHDNSSAFPTSSVPTHFQIILDAKQLLESCLDVSMDTHFSVNIES